MSTSEISYHQLAMQGRDGSDRTVSCLCLAASCGLSADHHTFIFIFLFIFLKNKVKRENSFFFFFYLFRIFNGACLHGNWNRVGS